jgi:hypothetical protein
MFSIHSPNERDKIKKLRNMTEQEFIDYMAPYGTHVQFTYDDDVIQKKIHLTPYNSNYTYFPHISNGKKYHMEFEINGKKASIKECASFITKYKREQKLKQIGI